MGVSDLTLLSKISNESINENLRKRFEHGEIYVSPQFTPFTKWKLIFVRRLISAMCWSPSIRFGTVSLVPSLDECYADLVQWASILTRSLIVIRGRTDWRFVT